MQHPSGQKYNVKQMLSSNDNTTIDHSVNGPKNI
jgi:hypothetical protein